MPTFARTTLLTMLVTVAVLAAWSLVRGFGSPAPASAAAGLQVPTYCIPPELPGIQDMLSRTTDPGARRLLFARQKAAEQSARDCALNATAHPPARKPAHPGLLPAPVPAATATPQVGIQHAELLPVDDFLPAQDGNNMWSDWVNGHALEVFTGSLSGPDDNAFQSRPDWAKQPQFHVQGALRVVIDGDGLNARDYPAPARHGVLHLLNSCGFLLLLQAEDGTTSVFDTASLRYINRPSSCQGY